MIINKRLPSRLDFIARPTASVMATNWQDPDVHGWTARMREILSREWSELPKLCADAECRRGGDIVATSKSRISTALHHVLDKLQQRKGVKDDQLCAVTPMGLFVLAAENSDITTSQLEDCLTDMGNTCLQGDTHRLFSLLLAHRRSKQ
jgi:hypothetical protein